MGDASGGGGGGLAGLSDLLGGVGKFFEKNPEGAASMLGQLGSAVAGPETWQGRLGGAAAGMAQNEQARKFLSELLGQGQEDDEDSMALEERIRGFPMLSQRQR